MYVHILEYFKNVLRSIFYGANSDLKYFALVLTKEFIDDPVRPGGEVTLEFTIVNQSISQSVTDIAFFDDLDSALLGLTAIGLPPVPCGAGSSVVGTDEIALTGGELEPEESCTFEVILDVPENADPGTYTNTTSTVMITGVPVADPATDDLEVTSVIINEVDADTASIYSAEFVELYDGGAGNTDLTGTVIVLYDGSDDSSYLAFDLDGQSTDDNGYFVLCGNPGEVPNCDLDVSPDMDLIQNGADAVAIHTGDASDFPEDTPLTTANLLDALVYNTDDADDAGLLPLLNAAQPQVNESGGGDPEGHSNQRCPNGTGGARNTVTYEQRIPTPGEENTCGRPVGPMWRK